MFIISFAYKIIIKKIKIKIKILLLQDINMLNVKQYLKKKKRWKLIIEKKN